MSSRKKAVMSVVLEPRDFRYRQRDIAIVLNEHCRSR